MEYIAHKNEEKEQLLKDHLQEVAKLSSKFAKSFKSENISFIIGLLHDIGKYSDSFQRRIRGSSERTDHSTAGAVLSKEIYNELLSKIIGYCVAGHHSGLPDYGNDSDYKESSNLCGRYKKDIDDFEAYKTQIKIDEDIDLFQLKNIFNADMQYDYTFSFYIRMLFSCLVDSDYLDTEKFMNENIDRKSVYNFVEMKKLLEKRLSEFSDKKGLINEKRKEILNSCIKHGKKQKGLYSLTVPTGGGKTLSSMAFALNHIIEHKMKRIIYVIPYSSIIEQTAKEFKKIFGEDLVIEHHYNYEYDYDENFNLSLKQQKLKLASQNWDMPIIVTTNVQFFESIYSNKSSRCRKLHNIAESVVIFDEVQMFPYNFLTPCISAVWELVKNYGVTALFCSATQPDFMPFYNFLKITEIIKDPISLNEIFKRVSINKIGKLENTELIKKIKTENQVLVIVNSRKSAIKLYNMLNDKQAFCLSTLLTPKDRKINIELIKERLKNGQPCIVISTQLIEAGVDIDFPVVYRAIAGIDSIVQSAGRSNREGKLKRGEVNVFIPEESIKSKNGHLSRGIQIGSIIMDSFDDIISIEAVKEYFNYAYDANNLDNKEIMDCFVKIKGKLLLDYDFKQASEKFVLIENIQKPIIIKNEKNEKLINDILYMKSPYKNLYKLQKDTVMVYNYEFKKLFEKNKLKEIIEDIFVLNDDELYNEHLGLNVYYDDITLADYIK